jgi:hypothetical protein
MQSLAIKDFGIPTYFLHSSSFGAYYPIFAFNGGSLYAAVGSLAVVVGPTTAFILANLAAFATAYGGWFWIARQAGIPGNSAHLPAVIAVSASYAVSLAYGRGDFPEMVATSAIPMVAASALSLLRSDQLRASSVAAFITSVAVLTGSHTLTLAWGVTFLIVMAGVAGFALSAATWKRPRRLLQIGVFGAIGTAVNAWFLVPLLLYHQRVIIGDRPYGLSQTEFTSPSQLFSPLRNGPATDKVLSGDIDAQLPVLAIGWAIVVGFLAWRGMLKSQRRLAFAITFLFAGIVLLVLVPATIDALPEYLRFIQFPYRLVTYADLLVVGSLVLVLIAIRSRRGLVRPASAALAVIAAVSVVLATDQAFRTRSWLPNRDVALRSSVDVPDSWYAGYDFSDRSYPLVRPHLPGQIHVPVEKVRALRYDVTYPPGRGGTIATNVAAGPYFVAVKGAEPVGRTREGLMVLWLPPSARRRQIEFSPARSVPLVAGQVLSLLAVASAVAVIAVLILRRRHEAVAPN